MAVSAVLCRLGLHRAERISVLLRKYRNCDYIVTCVECKKELGRGFYKW